MVDLDATYSYSRIVAISSRDGVELYRVYPNPSQGRSINIATNGPISSFRIFNVAGHEVSAEMSGASGKYKFKFATNVEDGLYIINYKTDGQEYSQPFTLND